MATATAWVRSLSCKSTAVADEAYSPPTPAPKKHAPSPVKVSSALLPGRKSRRSSSRSSEHQDRPATTTTKKKEPSGRKPKQLARLTASPTSSPARPSPAAFLAMTELPEGHPSRRVVELIFASGWGPAHDAPVPEAEVEVEALFRVRGSARAVARFEDARRAAALAPGADARCAADGNEMMRFQCRAPDGGGQVICAAVATTGASAVRTFAGSGAAHAGAAGGGGGSGRWGMLVCRVIAGRVRRATDPPCGAGERGYDSVEAGGGELVVLDRRAVLPCFLVVYKVRPALDSSSSRRRSSR